MEVKNKGYSEGGASYTRKALKGMIGMSGSPQEDIDLNNYTLRQRSRLLIQSSSIARSAVTTNRTNVIGEGLKLKPTIDRQFLGMSREAAKEWQLKTEKEFALWAKRKETCDATGVNNFYGIQQLCLQSWLASGDVFVLFRREKETKNKPYSLRLHVIEADRIRTPQSETGVVVPGYPTYTTAVLPNGSYIHDGVEIDKNGKILAYHIANTYPYDPMQISTEWVRIEAYGKESDMPNILHIMEAERPEQYRGLPYLATVIEPILQMRRYTDAEIMAAVVQSFYTAFVTTEAPANEMPFNEPLADEDVQVSSDEDEYELGPGTVNIMKPGESISSMTPTHPHSGFDVFMHSMAEQVGAALEIPVDLLLKQFNSSYSASRAALLEAWKAFKMRRTWLVDDFCRPVYEMWLSEAVARGRILAPGFFTNPLVREAYLQAMWIGPSQGQLDPTKEVQAAVSAIEQGLSTREQEAIKLNGSEFEANVDKLAIENEKLKAAGGGQSESAGQKIEQNIEEIAEKTARKEQENAENE